MINGINKIFSYYSFFLVLSGLCAPLTTVCQSENHLLHLDGYDEYVDYQLLPDGTCRMFFLSNQQSGWGNIHANYVDIKPGVSLDSLEMVDLTMPNQSFNFALYQLFTLHLKDGATLLTNTQWDCDFDPPGGLMMLDQYGEVLWFRDFHQENIYETGGEMVFADKDVIFIKDMYNADEGFLIDRNGQILDLPLPADPYDQTIETSYGFVARVNDRLDVLDSSFQAIYSYSLDQEIQTLQPLGNERFMIRTDAKFYELDAHGVLKYLPLTSTQYSIVWKSPEHYWALSNTLQAVIKLDTLFTPVDSLVIQNGIQVKMGFSSLDPYVVSEFIGWLGRGIVAFKGNGEDLQLKLPYDIGITAVTIPDTVWVDPSSAPLWGLWTYRYEFADVEVTNFGTDTVFNYKIESLDAFDCFFCQSQNWFWDVDTPLPPGMSTTFSLGPLFFNCIQNNHSPLCITTMAPNNKADGNYENDKFCQPINTIILANNEPEAFVQAQFYPNPADNKLIIEMTGMNSYWPTGSLYDLTGRLITSFEITGNRTELFTGDWPPGVYMVRLTGPNGNFITRKLVIQH